MNIFSRFYYAFLFNLFFMGSSFAQDSESKMFTSEENSYAAFSLRRVLGCVVDSFWVAPGSAGGSCDSADTIVAQSISYFNVACLIFASVVATYTCYTIIADTANDGAIFGRSSDTKYTLLKAGIGAVLALPLSSGYSVIQIIMIQVIMWSTGLGDNIWKHVAGNFLTNSSRSVVINSFEGDNDSTLKRTVSHALKVRVQGHVCKHRLEELAKNMSGGTPHPIQTASGSSWQFDTTSVHSLHFKGDSYYNNSESLCGTIFFKESKRVGTGSVFGHYGSGSSQQLRKAIIDASVKSINTSLNAGLGEIDIQAKAIADIIISSRDNNVVGAKIFSAVRDITKKVMDSTEQSLNSDLSNVQSKVSSALDDATDNGWMFAPLYQRLIVNAYAGMNGNVSSLKFNGSPPEKLTSYVGGFFTSFATSHKAIISAYERDVAYLDSLDGVFTTAGSGSAVSGIGTNSSVPDLNIKSDSIWGGILNSLVLQNLAPDGDASEWRDPIPDIQAVGTKMTYLATLLGGLHLASAAVEGSDVPIVAGLGSVSSTVITPLFYITFALAYLMSGVIPLLPVIYFAGAALNWLILVFEALIAAPIWLLTYFFPSREGNLLGSSKNGIVLICGVFLRPALIIVGLVVSMIIMRVGIDFIFTIFLSIFNAVTTGGGIFGAGNTFLVFGILTMLVVSIGYIVTMACSLISELGDAVMRWVDNNIGSLFNKHSLGDTIGGSMSPGSRAASLGSSAGYGRGGLAKSLADFRRGKGASGGDNKIVPTK